MRFCVSEGGFYLSAVSVFAMLVEISWVFMLIAFILAYYVLQYHSNTDVEKEEHQLAWYQSRRRLSLRAIYLFLFLSALFMLLHAVVSAGKSSSQDLVLNGTLSS